MRMKLHIGDEIRRELRRQERSVSWLAGKLDGVDPSNLNRMLLQKNVKPALVFDISIVLKKDLFSLCSQELSQYL